MILKHIYTYIYIYIYISLKGIKDSKNQEFQRIYAELISLVDKKEFQTVSWARMYQDSSVVIDADDEADRDKMIQSAMIVQLTANGCIEEAAEEEMIENWDSEANFDRYMTIEEQVYFWVVLLYLYLLLFVC
jgi:hypothetical protein